MASAASRLPSRLPAARRRVPGQGLAHSARQGLSSDEIAARYRAQHGQCMICGDPLTAPEADHDHALAALHGHSPDRGCRLCFRALLCGPCNRVLGAARDDPRTLEVAAAYLRQWRAEHPL